MTILKVEEMHCEMCVKRISNALKEAGIAFEISLANKTVAVEVGQEAKAIAELDDLGFDVVQDL